MVGYKKHPKMTIKTKNFKARPFVIENEALQGARRKMQRSGVNMEHQRGAFTSPVGDKVDTSETHRSPTEGVARESSSGDAMIMEQVANNKVNVPRLRHATWHGQYKHFPS